FHMLERLKALSGNLWFWVVVAVVAAAIGWYLVQHSGEDELPPGIASGNGRIEAVAIDIAARTGGRVREILAQEGEAVAAGQILARMDTQQLDAQLREAQAQLRRGRVGRDVAESG